MSITLYKDRPTSPISLKIDDENKRQYFKNEIEKLNKEIEKQKTENKRLNDIILTNDYLIQFRNMLSLNCPNKGKPITIIQCSHSIKRLECRSCIVRNKILNELLNAKTL